MPRSLLLHLQNSFLGKTSLAALMALAAGLPLSNGHAAVTAGGIAIIGYTDNSNGSDDTFSIAALEEITIGTTLYFTDNGWNTVDGKFRGATNLDGNGGESLIKLTFTANVAAGTIMKSGFDDAGFEWDAASLPPNANNGNFSFLNLTHDGTGDQIYAFEGTNSLPLLNPTNHVYLLDLGDFNNLGFEDATDPNTGNLPPGLQTLNNTAVSLPDGAAGDDANDFHNGSFALDMTDSDVAALNVSGGTKAQWLALIADSTNWLKLNFTGTDVDAESQLSLLNIAAAPEPSRALCLALGGFALLLRRRRQSA